MVSEFARFSLILLNILLFFFDFALFLYLLCFDFRMRFVANSVTLKLLISTNLALHFLNKPIRITAASFSTFSTSQSSWTPSFFSSTEFSVHYNPKAVEFTSIPLISRIACISLAPKCDKCIASGLALQVSYNSNEVNFTENFKFLSQMIFCGSV